MATVIVATKRLLASRENPLSSLAANFVSGYRRPCRWIMYLKSTTGKWLELLIPAHIYARALDLKQNKTLHWPAVFHAWIIVRFWNDINADYDNNIALIFLYDYYFK